MTKLKLSAIPDDKPVKLSVELPADVHRDLTDYARVLGNQIDQELEPAQLIAPMIARFIATDRGFAKARKAAETTPLPNPPGKTHESGSGT
ncbi:small protein [Jannaschia sp. EhC01]|nr:small protein [Jannaschia sp. EhC01]